MRLNIFRPREAVASAFEEPNIALSFTLVILAPIVASLLGFLASNSINIVAVIANIIANLLLWFVVAAIAYIVLFVFVGKTVEGSFSGMLSAFSLVFGLIAIISQVIGYVAYLPIAYALKAKLASLMSAQALTKVLAEGAIKLSVATLIVAGIIVIIELILALFTLYIFYLIVSHFVEERPLLRIVAFLIIATIAVAISSAIYTLF